VGRLRGLHAARRFPVTGVKVAPHLRGSPLGGPTHWTSELQFSGEERSTGPCSSRPFGRGGVLPPPEWTLGEPSQAVSSRGLTRRWIRPGQPGSRFSCHTGFGLAGRSKTQHLPQGHTCPDRASSRRSSGRCWAGTVCGSACTVPHAVLVSCWEAHVGTLALALPKDTRAQSARAGSGRCARPPHLRSVQVSAVPVGVLVHSQGSSTGCSAISRPLGAVHCVTGTCPGGKDHAHNQDARLLGDPRS